MFHHRPQAARRLARQLVQQLEVAAQQLGVAEPGRRQRQVGQNQRYHRTRGQRRQLHQRLDDVGYDVLADFLRNHWHLLHVGHDEILALTQCAHRLDANEIILDALRRHDALRLEPRSLNDLEVTEVVGIDALQVFGKLGMHQDYRSFAAVCEQGSAQGIHQK